ncbi:hypothetical protein CPB83DRAFT_901432 [Crepidotus variabilis]|uniref:Uncharacterized protein n=1 Tax=Crepidotus variabilis TaxID=179855 RepID=A0A9P6EVD1_9AGAR|nr:hypothetical protein CPB83DRAFT_901432 [Crepidotus variabilis]
MSETSGSLQRRPSGNSQSSSQAAQDQSNTPVTRNIQEASDALQTAYERIREVRRSLVQLSRSLPSTLSLEGEPQQRPGSEANLERQVIGPRHDALLLPGGAAEEIRPESPISFSRLTREFDELLEARERDAIPPQAIPAPLATSRVATIPRQLGIPNRDEPNTATTNADSSPNDVVPPRFTRPPRGAQPRLGGESAATTRGLRVAAREANPDNPPPLIPNRNRLAIFASTLNEYQRMLDHQQTMLGGAIENFPSLPRVEPVTTTPSSAASNRMNPSSIIASRYRRANNLIAAQQSLDTPLDPSNRMSVLPPPPIPRQNDERSLSAPGTSGAERDTTLILPRFRVYADSQRFVRTTGDDWTSWDLDELAQDFSPWFFPALQDHPPSLVPRQDPQNPDSLPTTRPADSGATRQRSATSGRRGWARLDPDGNEIPWEDEEALERMRPEYRLRAQQRARQDPDSHASIRSGRPFYGSITDSQLSVPNAPGRNRYSSAADTPLFVDPLPMPLSEMTQKEDFQDEFYPDVFIPVHACLAGR